MDNEQPQHADGQPYMSRRQRRELMRSQNRSGISGPRLGGTTKRILLWAGALAAIALVGWGMVKLSQSVPTASTGGALTVAVGPQDNIRGPADATVTLVEYSDFQCPACAAFFPIVAKAFTEPELKDHLRLAYRFFPLTSIHPNAQLSAQAAQAAALQGKFWEMHDLLFEKQDAWAGLSSAAARAVFVSYAEQLGLDKTKFLSDIDSNAVKDRVKTDFDSGTASGVNSTPSFYINGVSMVHPQSYEEFKQNLINALNENK